METALLCCEIYLLFCECTLHAIIWANQLKSVRILVHFCDMDEFFHTMCLMNQNWKWGTFRQWFRLCLFNTGRKITLDASFFFNWDSITLQWNIFLLVLWNFDLGTFKEMVPFMDPSIVFKNYHCRTMYPRCNHLSQPVEVNSWSQLKTSQSLCCMHELFCILCLMNQI